MDVQVYCGKSNYLNTVFVDLRKTFWMQCSNAPVVESDIDNVKKKISTATDYLSKKTRDNSKMLHRAIDAM